jgi:hypothetical protein
MASLSNPCQCIADQQWGTVACASGGFVEALPNPTLERNATSVAPQAFAPIVSVSRGAAGGVRSTLR